MQISKRCQYAVRAIFELAYYAEQGPVKIEKIAQAQGIPLRFLEVILSQMKRGGFVGSMRGNGGGYQLTRAPMTLSVGEVIRFMQGPLEPVERLKGNSKQNSPLLDGNVFLSLWQRAGKALSDVYDKTTFQDLVEEEARMREQYVPSYSI